MRLPYFGTDYLDNRFVFIGSIGKTGGLKSANEKQSRKRAKTAAFLYRFRNYCLRRKRFRHLPVFHKIQKL